MTDQTTSYEVRHFDRPVSPRYGTWSEAELFLLFDTPATADYRVVPVAATPDAPTGLTLHTDTP